MKYEVIDVPQPENCQNCTPCMRMKLMELGFILGQEIEVNEKMNGMYIVDMYSPNGNIEQTIALRKEELGRICLNEKNG
jgi:Fe2+ transport system protein FeoA